VMYDDGTPVPNLRLEWEAVEAEDLFTKSLPTSLMILTAQTNSCSTDDQGRFRMIGLDAGKYRLLAHMTLEDEFQWSSGVGPGARTGSAQTMTVYAPGKFRKSEAQVVEVRGDEEVPDVEIKIALNDTHAVSGRIVAKEDNHAPNHSVVTINDPTGELPSRNVRANEQGQFHFSYVPAGTYELQLRGIDSVLAPNERYAGQMMWQVVKLYQPVKVSVIVGDQDVKVDDVLVEAAKKAKE
jgi:hypothetical protein